MHVATRWPWNLGGALALTVVLGSSALAAPNRPLPHHAHVNGLGTSCVTVPMPESAFTPHLGEVSRVLYLERCVGGCTVRGGAINDARTMTSAIPQTGSMASFPEFTNHLGETGAAADAEWNAFVSCVRKVYSYYDVEVTDQRPVGGPSYHLNLVSGTPGLIGLPNGTLGISPFACRAQDNVISFSFANAHSKLDADSYVQDLCWTATHEAGHAYSLEHAWTYTDGRSACNDPMSYPTGACNTLRYFRNEPVNCGGFSPEPCVCGSTQNSHAKLLGVFGAGTPSVAPPTVEIVNPAPNAQVGLFVNADAGSPRGISRVELFINGYEWGEAKGAPFGQNGQPTPFTYSVRIPDELPGGVLDIMVRAYDDIGASTDSAVVTAMKGAPCASADSCAPGQACEAGKCFWDAPSGEIGDACTYPQFCLSGKCQGTATQQICTQACILGVTDSCPVGLECIEAGPGNPICFPPVEDSGGCSAGAATSPLAAIGLGALASLVLFRRRRR